MTISRERHIAQQENSSFRQIRTRTPVTIAAGKAKVVTVHNDNNDRTERRNLSFLQSPHCEANCLQHLRSSGQGAMVRESRATHIECLSRATCVPHGTKGQLSY